MGMGGMVTFIAAYHYLRIFNSWVEAYEYKPNKTGEVEDPVLTGVPFNDAYRYMDWLLTVPMLLIEIVFVMKLPDDQIRNKSISLGVSSGLMICVGYPGELVVEGNLGVRWVYWALALCPFLNVVYELLVGMAAATNSESDPMIKSMIQRAQLDRRELVDLPSCLHLPNDWIQWFPCSCGHPGGLLHLGHHFQVRRWPCDLWCYSSEVRGCQGGRFVATVSLQLVSGRSFIFRTLL